MIKEYLHRRKMKKAIQEAENSTLGKALAAHTDEYFNKIPRLSDLSEETKNKSIDSLYQQLFDCSGSKESGHITFSMGM